METEQTPLKEKVSISPFDAIVLLCGAAKKQKSGNWILNFESKLKVAAAAEIYHQGLARVIISSGGPLFGAPPLGKMMGETLSRKFGVPPEAIVEENNSMDTGMQAEFSIKVIKERGFRTAAILADSEHLKRTRKLFQSYGFEPIPLAAEEYLLKRSPHYRKIVDKLHGSWYWKYWKIRETLLRAIIFVDKKQTLGRGLARLWRARPT